MGPYSVELAARKRLAEDIRELTFTRPENFQFIPGQYIRFHFQGLERDYTLVGAGAAFAFQGHVTQYLDQVLSRGEYRFYICGGRQMIQDAWAL